MSEIELPCELAAGSKLRELVESRLRPGGRHHVHSVSLFSEGVWDLSPARQLELCPISPLVGWETALCKDPELPLGSDGLCLKSGPPRPLTRRRLCLSDARCVAIGVPYHGCAGLSRGSFSLCAEVISLFLLCAHAAAWAAIEEVWTVVAEVWARAQADQHGGLGRRGGLGAASSWCNHMCTVGI